MSTSLGPPRIVGWRPDNLEQARAPLSWREKLSLVAEILWAYRRARRLLRQGPLPLAMLALRRDRGSAPAGFPVEPDQRAYAEWVVARKLGRAVTRTLRAFPMDGRCLIRSLTLAALLEARGIDCGVVIGARTDAEFSAHAWVEVGEFPVLETDPAVFQPLWRG